MTKFKLEKGDKFIYVYPIPKKRMRNKLVIEFSSDNYPNKQSTLPIATTDLLKGVKEYYIENFKDYNIINYYLR